jgi:hypothetical protein
MNDMELERDRQLREVSESLIKKGKNLLNISQKELNRELQLWLINEKRRKLREGKTEKEQIMDLFFK